MEVWHYALATLHNVSVLKSTLVRGCGGGRGMGEGECKKSEGSMREDMRGGSVEDSGGEGGWVARRLGDVWEWREVGVRMVLHTIEFECLLTSTGSDACVVDNVAPCYQQPEIDSCGTVQARDDCVAMHVVGPNQMDAAKLVGAGGVC